MRVEESKIVGAWSNRAKISVLGFIDQLFHFLSIPWCPGPCWQLKTRSQEFTTLGLLPNASRKSYGEVFPFYFSSRDGQQHSALWMLWCNTGISKESVMSYLIRLTWFSHNFKPNQKYNFDPAVFQLFVFWWWLLTHILLEMKAVGTGSRLNLSLNRPLLFHTFIHSLGYGHFGNLFKLKIDF